MSAAERLSSMLDVLDKRHHRRRLIPRAGLDFASNDYLGLANSPFLREAALKAIQNDVPVGSGGSRLLRGNHIEHERLEERAAEFFGTEAALFMGGGFQANEAIFATLPAANDLIVYDEYIHASAHEGMRSTRAQTLSFVHNDVADAAKKIDQWRAQGGDGQIWLAAEAVYSMDGDLCPIAELDRLAAATNAVLILDEAHATGVLGRQGRGLSEGLQSDVLSLHTCGKGLGVSGGLICGSQIFIDVLINKARPFIFATAPSPLNAAMVRAAIDLIESDSSYADRAHDRTAHAADEAHRLLGRYVQVNSHIIPIVLGENERTMSAASRLQTLGFDVRGIRPPTVPKGTSRLRLSITGNVTKSDITGVFEAVAQILEEEA